MTIDLYTWVTANSQKVNIAVCELDLDVDLHPINIGKGEQHAPAYLKVNPNNKVPAIVDGETGIRMFESGAILMYLAERTDRLMPHDPAARWEATQWIFWQMAGLGPVAGQFNHFAADEARGTYARDRFRNELQRLIGILEGQLAGRDHVAGSYSMADIALWPGVSRYERLGLDLDEYPNLRRWYRRIAEREAVQRGFEMLQPGCKPPLPPA